MQVVAEIAIGREVQRRVVLVLVIADQVEAALITGIDVRRVVERTTEALIDPEAKDIRATVQVGGQPVEHPVLRAALHDETVARVRQVVALLDVEGVVVIIVVPVVLAVGGAAVHRATPLPVLQRTNVDLATEPEKLLHDRVVVARAGPVLPVVARVLEVGARCKLGRHLQRAVQQTGGLLEGVVRDIPVDVVEADRHPRVCSFRPAAHRDCRAECVSGLEEILDVVRMRDPGLLRPGELVDEPTVELRAPALIAAVAVAATLPVDVLEFPPGALAVAILKVGNASGFVEGVERRRFGTDAATGRETLLRRYDHRAVLRARAVDGSRVRALQDRHRLDVLGVDVADRVAEIVAVSKRAAAIRVRHGNPVDDEQRLIVAREGIRPTDDEVRRAAGSAGAGDRDTRDLALCLLDEVDGLRHRQVRRRQLLLRRAERALGPDHASGSHDHIGELRDRDTEAEVLCDGAAAERDPRAIGRVSNPPRDENDRPAGSARRRRDDVAAARVGVRTDAQLRYAHRYVFDRTSRVSDVPGHARPLLRGEREREEPGNGRKRQLRIEPHVVSDSSGRRWLFELGDPCCEQPLARSVGAGGVRVRRSEIEGERPSRPGCTHGRGPARRTGGVHVTSRVKSTLRDRLGAVEDLRAANVRAGGVHVNVLQRFVGRIASAREPSLCGRRITEAFTIS